MQTTLASTARSGWERRTWIMCLTCGCMDAHREMGESNITYDDIKRAADENGRSVEETLQIFDRTESKDRGEHPQEYQTTASTSA
jgi:hypothetical protein